MLQQLARDFAEEEVKPNAGKWDSTSEFPRQAIKKANEFGLLTLKIPENHSLIGKKGIFLMLFSGLLMSIIELSGLALIFPFLQNVG